MSKRPSEIERYFSSLSPEGARLELEELSKPSKHDEFYDHNELIGNNRTKRIQLQKILINKYIESITSIRTLEVLEEEIGSNEQNHYLSYRLHNERKSSENESEIRRLVYNKIEAQIESLGKAKIALSSQTEHYNKTMIVRHIYPRLTEGKSLDTVVRDIERGFNENDKEKLEEHQEKAIKAIKSVRGNVIILMNHLKGKSNSDFIWVEIESIKGKLKSKDEGLNWGLFFLDLFLSFGIAKVASSLTTLFLSGSHAKNKFKEHINETAKFIAGNPNHDLKQYNSEVEKIKKILDASMQIPKSDLEEFIEHSLNNLLGTTGPLIKEQLKASNIVSQSLLNSKKESLSQNFVANIGRYLDDLHSLWIDVCNQWEKNIKENFYLPILNYLIEQIFQGLYKDLINPYDEKNDFYISVTNSLFMYQHYIMLNGWEIGEFKIYYNDFMLGTIEESDTGLFDFDNKKKLDTKKYHRKTNGNIHSDINLHFFNNNWELDLHNLPDLVNGKFVYSLVYLDLGRRKIPFVAVVGFSKNKLYDFYLPSYSFIPASEDSILAQSIDKTKKYFGYVPTCSIENLRRLVNNRSSPFIQLAIKWDANFLIDYLEKNKLKVI